MPIFSGSDRSTAPGHLRFSGFVRGLLSAALACLALSASAGGVQRTVPLQPVSPALESSPGKLSPDLVSLIGGLSGMTPQQRAAGTLQRADHLALPVYRTAGRDAAYLQVYAHVRNTSKATLDALRSEGMVIEYVEPSAGVVQGYVRLEAVECVAELECVRGVSRPNYSICNTAQVGSVLQGLFVSKADELLETDFMRATGGLDGTGVTIGVLSVGLFDTFFPAPRTSDGALSDARVRNNDFPKTNPQTGLAEDLGGIRIFPSQDYTRHIAPTFASLVLLPEDLALDPISGEQVPYYQQRPPIWQTVIQNESRRPRPTGALMLEAVHDLAPRSRLLFGSSRTDVEFYLNRERLVNEGAKVIVDDVSFPGLGRYDGTSALSSRATQLVRSRDVVVVTAVGDQTPPTPTPTPTPPPTPTNPTPTPTPVPEVVVSATGKPLFLNAFFNPNPTNVVQKFHGFNDPSSVHRDETLEVRTDPSMGVFEAFLVWDDVWVNPQYDYTDGGGNYHKKYQAAGRASDDLDLFLVDRETLNILQPIAVSNTRQDGKSGNPVERILLTGPTSNKFSLLIRRKNPLDNRRTFFTLVITAGLVEEPQYLTHGIPLCNADALGGVISVGSIDIRAIDLERVTVDSIPGHDPGPGAMKYGRFLQWRSGAQKPDICSYENVETYTGRSHVNVDNRYYARGSSIAAAHVGAFCALIRQMRPDLKAEQFHGLLTKTVPPAGIVDPKRANSIPIMTNINRLYGNAPEYKRLEGGNVFRNLLWAPFEVGPAARVSALQSFAGGSGLWTNGPESGSPFALPVFDTVDGLLEMRATQLNTFGYWESPILSFAEAGSGAPSSALDANHLYRLRARVSSSQPDPNKVPDFRIRLITSSADEAVELVVNSKTLDGANAPRDGQPRDYFLYYQPTPEAALFGVRVAIDMIHFNKNDDSTASIFIHEVDFEELEAPALPAAN